jgi:hypothetical protein
MPGTGNSAEITGNPNGQAEKEWTIMIYMAGDNDLSVDMVYALEDVKKVIKKDSKANLLVYYDSSAQHVPTLYCDFTSVEAPCYQPSYLVPKNFVSNDRARRFVENENYLFDENSAAAYSILNFVDWCLNVQKKRTPKYALIFSGHGSAFQNKTLMIDSASDYYLTVSKLRWVLERITTKTPDDNRPLLIGQAIDILGFDSCVMGMIELAYEFGKYTKNLVASEGSIPSAGWAYGNILSELISAEKAKSETDIAKVFVENFIEKQADFAIGGVSVDMAASNLEDGKVEAILALINNLGEHLFNALQDDSKIKAGLERALLYCHWRSQSYLSEQNVDLMDFCQLLSDELANFEAGAVEDLTNDCHAIITAINDCVLQCGFSGGTFQFSNGFSIFFPWSAVGYLTFQKDYEKLMVIEDQQLDKWKRFLEYYLTKASLRPAREKTDDISTLSTKTFYPAKNIPKLETGNSHKIEGERAITEMLIIETRDNPALGTKGSQFIGQFKNIHTPFGLAGFTKKTS